MKHLFLTFALFIMATMPAHADNHMKKEMMAEAGMTVVVYTADWCGSCKILDPAMKEAMAMEGFPEVTVVKFDMTDAATKAASAKMAEEKGLSKLYDPSSKTGFALIVDSETHDVLAKVTKAYDANNIAAIFKAVDARS